MREFLSELDIKMRESGWFKGRVISTNEFRNALENEGYVWSLPVEKFLSEFGGLMMTFQSKDGSKNHIHFDAVKAAMDIDPSWVIDLYSRRLNKRGLAVIGQAFSGHLTLIMSQDGCVYGGYDDVLVQIGTNHTEAIEALFLNLPGEAIN